MTITHEVEREEVMAYLDGELPPARAMAIRAHLDQCEECAALADDLRQVSAGLGEWEVEDAPVGLSGHRAIGLWEEHRGRVNVPRFRISWRWTLLGAALVGVFVMAVVVSQRQGALPAAIDVIQPAPATSIDGALAPVPSPAPRMGRGGPGGGGGGRGLGYASGRSGSSAPPDPHQIIGMTPGLRLSQGGVVTGGADLRRLQGTSTGTTAADNQMIVRTASISVSTEKFDDIRAALERMATTHHGSVSALTLAGDPPNRRTLSATVRVPIAEMDAALTSIRALGKVLQESQSSEDVTDAHRDLAIRIANAKVEEARLADILKNRTGRLSDVLEVEQAQSRVRTEIEQMEAQELAMRNRAALSTISVEIDERYRAELAGVGPLPIGQRLRNAIVDGARTAIDSLVGVTLALLGAAPTVLLWAAVLLLPARWFIRRMRRARLFSAQ